MLTQLKSWKRQSWIVSIIGILISGFPTAKAGVFEFSLGASYSRTQYDPNSFSWTKRYSTSLGYHFTAYSEIELSYQQNLDRVYLKGYQDTTTRDEILSVDIVQSFFSDQAFFQPYLKAGIGQLFREANGHYASGASPPAKVASVTAILGAGFKLKLNERFGIRIEAVSYLARGSIRSFGENVGYTAGASIYF